MPPRKKRLFRPSVPECGAEPEDHEPPAGAQTGRPQFDEVFSVIPEALPLVWHNICATPLAPEARRLTLDYDMIQVMTRLLDHFCCHPEGSMTITLTLRREWRKAMERLFAQHTAESILAVFKYPGQRSKASRDCFAPSHARGEDPGMNVKYALALMLLVPVSEVRSLHTDMEELTYNFNNLSLSSRSLHTQLAPRQRYMRATRAAFALSNQRLGTRVVYICNALQVNSLQTFPRNHGCGCKVQKRAAGGAVQTRHRQAWSRPPAAQPSDPWSTHWVRILCVRLRRRVRLNKAPNVGLNRLNLK